MSNVKDQLAAGNALLAKSHDVVASANAPADVPLEETKSKVVAKPAAGEESQNTSCMNGAICHWFGCGCNKTGDHGVTEIQNQRSCTDMLWLLLYVLSWAGVLALMGYAIGQGAGTGSIYGLLAGVDFKNGVACGTGINANLGCSAFPALGAAALGSTYSGLATAMFCVKCPTVGTNCTETTSDPRMLAGMTYSSTLFLGRFCVPAVTTPSLQLPSMLTSTVATASQAIGDLLTAANVIAVAAACALVVALIYLKLLQCCAGVLVYASLTLILLGGGLASAACFKYEGDQYFATGKSSSSMQGIGYFFGISTFVYFCMIVFMRDRISIAVQVTKEASKALTDMMGAMVFPVFPFLVMIGYFVWWIYTALLLFSVGYTPIVNAYPANFAQTYMPASWPNATNAAGVTGFMGINLASSISSNTQNALILHFFHLLWTVQFVVFFTFLAIAGAVANWYFTPWAGETKARGDGAGELPTSPVLKSCWRAARYHLGTISLAALIIAIIHFAEASVAYFERKAKDSGMNETLKKVIFCCIGCCLWCVECCMKQVNRNGLVFVAVYGTPFCPATCGAFTLAWANLGRVAWISMVGDFLLGIGKVLVALICTGISGLILFTVSPYTVTNNGVTTTSVSSPAFVLVVIFIITWCIASIFMAIYETCIDTVFMCFLIDEDNNKEGGKYLAHPDLLKLISDTAGSEEAKKEAAFREGQGKVTAGGAAADAPVSK